MNEKLPYRGLTPYTEEDAEFFFGRERWSNIIVDNLLAYRLTFLYGASGVGKSSVLRAGVAYRLRKAAKNNFERFGKPELVVSVFNSWRDDDPLIKLKEQIRSDIISVNPDAEKTIPPQSNSLTFQEWVKTICKDVIGGKLLIILDQFEDYFLYHRKKKEEIGTFAVDFPGIVNHPQLQANFLISIREESYSRLDRFKGSIPGLFNNYLRLEHMDKKSARDAINKPIGKYNLLRNNSEKAVRIESGLIGAVLKQIESDLNRSGQTIGEPGNSSEVPIETPLLQLVMTRLWETEMKSGSHTLKLETFNKLGAKEIVKKHLQDRMNKLSYKDKDIAAKAFNSLVTSTGTKYAYSVYDLSEKNGVDPAELYELLENLSSGGNRILRPVGPAPHHRHQGGTGNTQFNERYEIFHDVLAQHIVSWRERYFAKKRVEEEHKEKIRKEKEKARAERRKAGEQKRQRNLAIKQGLPAQSIFQQSFRQDEKAALLARQAFIFNRESTKDSVLDQVDAALRKTLTNYNFSNILMSAHIWGVSSVAFSPDGLTLASAGHDGTIKLWSLRRRPDSSTATLKVSGVGVNEVAISPDGQQLTSGSYDGRVRLWDIRKPAAAPKVLMGHELSVNSVKFSPDGKIIASAGDDGTIRLWNLEDLDKEAIILKGHGDIIRSLAFASDGNLLASCSDDRTIMLWNPNKREDDPIIFIEHEDRVNTVDFHPSGKYLASGSSDRTVRIWDLHDQNHFCKVLTGHKESVLSVAFSPDGSMLASGGEDQKVQLRQCGKWDGEAKHLEGHYLGISSVTFSPDGKLLASGSWDNTVRIFDLCPPVARPKVLESHSETITSVALSPDNHKIASSSWDRTVRVWNVKRPEETPLVLEGHKDRVLSVAFSPDCEMLASTGSDRTVRLWNLKSPQDRPRILEGHESGVCSAAFSPDGKMLATGSWDKSVRVWNLGETGNVRIIGSHEDEVTSVAFSPNGLDLASSSNDGAIKVWHLKDHGKKPRVLRGHPFRVWSVAFSPDGQTLASSSDDRTVRLWNLQHPGRKPIVLEGHNYWVASVAFSRDGKTLASGSFDRTIRLWDLTQHAAKPIVLRGHEQSVTSLAFGKDGNMLISGSYDNTIRIWIARTQILADMVCEKVLRNLTLDEWRWFMGRDIPYEPTCPNLPS